METLATIFIVEFVDMRNRLIHGYFSIDPDIVWNVVEEKLPLAIKVLRPLLDRAS